MADKVNKTLRFDARLIKKAEQLAKLENRSLNNWIETLMMREVRFDPFAKEPPDNGEAGKADEQPNR